VEILAPLILSTIVFPLPVSGQGSGGLGDGA
jgi:hypothetical protein